MAQAELIVTDQVVVFADAAKDCALVMETLQRPELQAKLQKHGVRSKDAQALKTSRPT